MTERYESLVAFEQARSQEEWTLPIGSNSFYQIGEGQINVYTKLDRLDLYTHKDTVPVGSNPLVLEENGYETITVIADTTLIIESELYIHHAAYQIHGTLLLKTGAKLIIDHDSIFYADSNIQMEEGSELQIRDGNTLTIYGRVDVHVDGIAQITENPNIVLDTAAVIKAYGIEGEDFENRTYSLTNYDTDLREQFINLYTQGETNTVYGRLGYQWTGGNPGIGSQILDIGVLWGEAILGDFRLSILGFPNENPQELQILSNFFVKQNATLYIADTYHGKKYLRPELYLGILIDNCQASAGCSIAGNVIVDGVDSRIFLDRGANIVIHEDGSIILRNGAKLISSYNEGIPVLEINGTLIMDTIDQIASLEAENIVFGKTGKVIIHNPDPGEDTILWTTPNGILNTDLYRLFKDTIDHVEYHVTAHCGIGIDRYYEYFSRDMTDWYGGRRIEKAIQDGILVWEDGAFLVLDHDMIPWVDATSTLLHASRVFKSYGSTDTERLQDVVERLRYAGCGNMRFRFVYGENSHEILLNLEGVTLRAVANQAMSNTYLVQSTGEDGYLYLKNQIPNTDPSTIITHSAKRVALQDGNTTFDLSP